MSYQLKNRFLKIKTKKDGYKHDTILLMVMNWISDAMFTIDKDDRFIFDLTVNQSNRELILRLKDTSDGKKT